MIKFKISRSVLDHAYPLHDYSISGNGGVLHMDAPILTIGSPDEDPLELNLPYGYLEQGTKSVGDLRDKSVLHLTAKGTVEYNVESQLPQYEGRLLVSKDGGTYYDDGILPAATRLLNIGGDMMWLSEQDDHILTQEVWAQDGHVVQTWLHEYPTVLYEWYGHWYLYGSGGYLRRTNLWSFNSEGILCYRNFWDGGGPTNIFVGGVSYEIDSGGISDFIASRSGAGWTVQSGVALDGDESDLDEEALLATLADIVEAIPTNFVYSHCKPQTSADEWGELTRELLTQLELVESNQLLNLLDLAGYADLAKGAVSFLTSGDVLSLADDIRKGVIKSAKSLKALFKGAAAVYLQKKYVYDTSVSDMREVQHGLETFLNKPKLSRLHSRKTSASNIEGLVVNHTAVLTVEIGAYPTWFTGKVQEFIGKAKHWGLYPDVTNLYDMLQYSFVVDWFVGFGDLVSSVNDYMDAQWYFPIKHCVQSEKWSFNVDADELFPDHSGITGQVEFSLYNRWITFDLPMPPVHLELGSGISTGSRGAQAAALTTQRVRH